MRGVLVRHRSLAAALLSLPWLGCTQPVPHFDERRAFADLVRQTEFGPRIPGTAAHTHCRDWMASTLSSLADTVILQNFRGLVPGQSDSIAMVNLIARFRSEQSERILIGAHWDTRPFADNDPDTANHRRPFDGANDGASGVAVLLELARAFDSITPPIGVDLVFFDGEDMGDYGATPGQWCQGSSYFASHLPARYAWGIIVDMVGARNLTLPMEGYSLRLAPDLTERVWTTAGKLGETAFVRARTIDLYDDHMPLLMRGIKVIDIVQTDYTYWHTVEDTADKCAPESLGSVGRVLLAVIYQ